MEKTKMSKTRHVSRRRFIRQATTAVENKASAAGEWCKELALWRVALAFGFVYDVDDFIAALKVNDAARGATSP